MKPSLDVGIENEATYRVTPEMAPAHVPGVLSTPSMVRLIEMTCLEAAGAHLDEGEVTVGTHVCVSHSGPARVGEDVIVRCRLAERDRRRVTFSVEVVGPGGTISEGTHQRAVVETSRFS